MLQNQIVLEPGQVGAVPISNDVHHIVGAEEHHLENPGGATLLVLSSEEGIWRVALGDRTAGTGTNDMPVTANPPTTLQTGAGAVGVYAGHSLVLSAPASITVRGYAATDVLTYWWL